MKGITDLVGLGTSLEGTPIEIDINGLIDSRMLVQGNSGSGKSWLMRLLCERIAGKIPFIVIDPEGEYASLREKVDVVIVGADGDIPADLRSAALLARKLVELQVSAVIDLYEIPGIGNVAQRRREFFKRFFTEIVNLPKELWHPTIFIIDEAHKFAPEKGQGDTTALDACLDFMSTGRKRGFCGILATQRFSKINNDAIAETNNVFIGRTWLDGDTQRAGKYLGIAPKDYDLLREMGKGEFYSFGPAMQHNGVLKFKSDKVATKHPKAGERHTIKPPKASAAISDIVSQIDDLPEIAEQEAKDLATFKEQAKKREGELLGEIQVLRSDLAKTVVPTEEKVYLIPDEKVTELQDRIDDYFKPFSQVLDNAQTTAGLIEKLIAEMRGVIPADAPKPVQVQAIAASNSISKEPIQRPVATPVVRKEPVEVGDLKLKDAQRRILNALAWFESIGNASPSNTQLGAVAMMDTTGGYFSNLVGPLSINGLVERSAGSLRLTDAGRAVADPMDKVPSLSDYHEMLRDRVRKMRSAKQRTVDILNVIIAAGGESVSNGEIGDSLAIDVTGGYFSNLIGPLSTLGLINRNQGTNVPTEILFPRGLS